MYICVLTAHATRRERHEAANFLIPPSPTTRPFARLPHRLHSCCLMSRLQIKNSVSTVGPESAFSRQTTLAQATLTFHNVKNAALSISAECIIVCRGTFFWSVNLCFKKSIKVVSAHGIKCEVIILARYLL